MAGGRDLSDSGRPSASDSHQHPRAVPQPRAAGVFRDGRAPPGGGHRVLAVGLYVAVLVSGPLLPSIVLLCGGAGSKFLRAHAGRAVSDFLVCLVLPTLVVGGLPALLKLASAALESVDWAVALTFLVWIVVAFCGAVTWLVRWCAAIVDACHGVLPGYPRPRAVRVVPSRPRASTADTGPKWTHIDWGGPT